MQAASLRLRLFGLILTPLIIMAIILGYWRFTAAQKTAEELFDRSLLSAALAISRDVVMSGGDAILSTTRDLIRDASGGEVFYHATGPSGIYVTGYGYPPVTSEFSQEADEKLLFFEAVYRDESVRVLRVTERVTVDALVGNATVTVWQRLSDRQAFASLLAARAAALILGLLATLALVVWFGVKLGLRPLDDLHEAIAARSPDDLSRIKRSVPPEVQGIVRTLNRLFGQVDKSIDAHQAFISDAAHQLRNPAAAVQSMAEAVRDAKDLDDQNERINELVSAARNSARVAEQLLSLDRLLQPTQPAPLERLNLCDLVEETSAGLAVQVLSDGIEFEVNLPDEDLFVLGDRVFLSEALKNLVDNALRHGGADLAAVTVTLGQKNEQAQLTVSDDGKGLSPDHAEKAFGRFSQVEPAEGSGLGLAIVFSVAERHCGTLSINKVFNGASLTLEIPIAQ